MLNRRVNKATGLCAFDVESNPHSIQLVSKAEHSSDVTVTAVLSIQSTKLHGGTSSTQYLVEKQIHNTNRHNLNSNAAILCNSNNFNCNICASIKVCFRAYGADKMFNQELFYRQHRRDTRDFESMVSPAFCSSFTSANISAPCTQFHSRHTI